METKICLKCDVQKDVSEFQWRKDRPAGKHCNACRRKAASEAVAKTRRKNKETLVAEHGSKCIDCGGTFPPYVLDFDHRDPTQKSFGVAKGGNTYALETLRAEAEKCDLVCANCHRERTHRQRCDGCGHCKPVGV